MLRLAKKGKWFIVGGLAAMGVGTAFFLHKIRGPAQTYVDAVNTPDIPINLLSPRKQHIENLKKKTFDVLIIGGGATGSGIALDAVSRGLDVAMVEREDWCSGTSGRSTKLIHGGVRYLEKAVKELDMEQLDLVRDALRERRHLIGIAPHLSRALPILVPMYCPFPQSLFLKPYYWLGMKMYDFFAGKGGILEPCYYMNRRQSLEKFPMLNPKGLKGALMYYDGQHNDSRMGLGIALTAATRGATIGNHIEVLSLLKDDKGKVCGARVKDHVSGEEFDVRSKYVVNATGPFVDKIRQMADPSLKSIIVPSAGVHVVLSERYCPEGIGMLIPNTSDGRVLFLLPWEGSTIAGTTDSKTDLTFRPQPKEQEIQFILKECSHFLVRDIKREDVDAAWSGIRPLAVTPRAANGTTAAISRDHLIEDTAPGLVTITGGKWTTYRKMAEDLLNHTLSMAKKENVSLSQPMDKIKPCHTTQIPLIGAAGWSLQLPSTLHRLGLDKDVAEHLSHNYGDKAHEVARIAQKENLDRRLAKGYPFLEAEVVFALRHEYACTAVDVIGNRLRLAYLNSEAAYQALPRVIELMGSHLGWGMSKKVAEYLDAEAYLKTMSKGPFQELPPMKDADAERLLKSKMHRGRVTHD